jgi:hypothetical protein
VDHRKIEIQLSIGPVFLNAKYQLPNAKSGQLYEDSMCIRANDAFSEVPGGRPPSFSRLISGGNRSPELVEGNAEGARLPRR